MRLTTCLISLLFLMNVRGAAGGMGGKVSTIIHNIPGVVERKSLAFFSHFGANLNRNRKDGMLDCDYNDPAKIHMCPPIPASPFPPAHKSTSPSEKEMSTSSSLSKDLVAKCLQNPNHPDCAVLDEFPEDEGGNDGSAPVQAPASAPESFVDRFLSGNGQPQTSVPTQLPVKSASTTAPTKNDCYGQMIDPRFCRSSMPSASLEPTDVGEDFTCEQHDDTPFMLVNPNNRVDMQEKCGYEYLPITVRGRTERRILFTVEQTWHVDELQWMSVVYEKGGEQVCY